LSHHSHQRAGAERGPFYIIPKSSVEGIYKARSYAKKTHHELKNFVIVIVNADYEMFFDEIAVLLAIFVDFYLF
jgi:hypothetical protein